MRNNLIVRAGFKPASTLLAATLALALTLTLSCSDDKDDDNTGGGLPSSGSGGSDDVLGSCVATFPMFGGAAMCGEAVSEAECLEADEDDPSTAVGTFIPGGECDAALYPYCLEAKEPVDYDFEVFICAQIGSPSTPTKADCGSIDGSKLFVTAATCGGNIGACVIADIFCVETSENLCNTMYKSAFEMEGLSVNFIPGGCD